MNRVVTGYVSVLRMQRGGMWWCAWIAPPNDDPWVRADCRAIMPAQTIREAIVLAGDALDALRAARGLPIGGSIVRLAQCWAAAESRVTKGKAPAFWDTSAGAKRARRQEDDDRQERMAREAGYSTWEEYRWTLLDERAREMGYASWADFEAQSAAEWRAFVGGPVVATSADLQALQVEAPVTPESIQKAYRRVVVAQKLHPDQGGDAAAFIAATAARDRLLAAAQVIA